MCLATFLAAIKSGDPFNPTENECSLDNFTDISSSFGLSAIEVNTFAKAEVTDESKPPDNNTPYGTSLIN